MVPQLEGPHVNCTTRCNSSAPAPTDAVRRAATPQHYKPLKNRNCDFSISASQVPSLTHGQRRPSRADWQHGTRSWLLTCSHAPVLGGGEHVPLGDDDGCDAENTDNDQVDEARLRVTVEGVIKPRNKTSHNQKSNTGVIQSRIGKKNPFTAEHHCPLQVPVKSAWQAVSRVLPTLLDALPEPTGLGSLIQTGTLQILT